MRTGRQRPPYALQARVPTQRPSGADCSLRRRRPAPRRTRANGSRARLEAGNATRTPDSRRARPGRPTIVTRQRALHLSPGARRCRARSQPSSESAATKATPPQRRSHASPRASAGATEAIVFKSTVNTPPSTASCESPRAWASATTSESNRAAPAFRLRLMTGCERRGRSDTISRTAVGAGRGRVSRTA